MIEFNCVYGNRVHSLGGDDKGLPSQAGQHGNMAADPQLAQLRRMDFHLQPTSPCLDAGKTTGDLREALDLDGQARVRGDAVDIGADESDGTLWPVATRVVHVSPKGDDTQDGSSWMLARRTVQAGIDAAKVGGGEMWVKAGTYAEHITVPAFVSLYGGFAGQETERSARDPAAQPTVLDGGGLPGVVTVQNAGFQVCEVDGFTITNGGRFSGGNVFAKYGIGGLGGGMRVVLDDFDGSGGGIFLACSIPVIEGNRIALNHAEQGAAIFSQVLSAPQILGNLVQSNSMYVALPAYQGSSSGAITIQQAPDFRIEGNTLAGNTAAVGAALNLSSCRAGRVQNNVFNLGVNYLSVLPGTDDFSVAPGWVEAANGDFRLAPDSPCIDRGTAAPTVGVEAIGTSRPLDGDNDGTAAPDVGAFEVVHPGPHEGGGGLRQRPPAIVPIASNMPGREPSGWGRLGLPGGAADHSGCRSRLKPPAAAISSTLPP